MMRQIVLGVVMIGMIFLVTSCSNGSTPKKATNANPPPPPPPPVDTTPPAQVTTLTVTSVTQNSASLRWTAVGDDGNVGAATAYVLRYSTSPIDAANWGSATVANGNIPELLSGQIQTYQVTGLSSDTTYYFAIMARDEAFNWSPLSNVPSVMTDSPAPPPPNLATLTARILNTTPAEHQVISGGSDIVVAKLELSASAIEAVVVNTLRLYNNGTASDDAFVEVRLVENGTELASTTVIGSYAEFTGINLVISAGGSRSLDIVCDFQNSDVVANIGGKTAWFGIRNLEDDWQQGAAPSPTNDSFNGMGETGDIKATGQVSGTVLFNSSDNALDQIVGDRGAGSNLGDGVGLVDRGGNTLTCKQHIIVNRIAPAVAANQPTGFQGFAGGADRVIGRFIFVVPDNAGASNPREIEVNSITVAIEGDAEAKDFEWYGDDPFNPIAVSAVIHRTTQAGGDPANPAHHVSVVTRVTFTLQGLNRFIPYGTQKAFSVRAKVYALTDPAHTERSLMVSIASFGTPDTAGDLIFRENGALVDNPDSFQWNWIDGLTSLEPADTMRFSGDLNSYLP